MLPIKYKLPIYNNIYKLIYIISNIMIIYNPPNEQIINERMKQAELVLDQIPAKYCFITGSFLYKEKYKDIDVFVLSRTKKRLAVKDTKATITTLDFNDLYSLFYHSVSKSCIAKNILPKKPLKVTIADYWQVINEAIPTLLNQKNIFHKNVRFLILYTEYLKTGEVLDTYQLMQKIDSFKNYKEIIAYIKKEVPKIIREKVQRSYAQRFFYTQAGHYKDLREYEAQNFLYELTHDVARSFAHG